MPVWRTATTPSSRDDERWTRLRTLTAAAVAGDSEAFGELVGVLRPGVRAVLHGFHRLSGADRQDIEQDVWEKLSRHLGRVEDPARLDGWIRSVARHHALRWLRRADRIVLDELLGETAPSYDDLDDLDHEAFWIVFARLPEPQQALLRLDSLGIYSYRELAMLLGRPIGSLGPTRHRSLERLKTLLLAAGVIDDGSVDAVRAVA
jgi:RNA polymerase sigma factor (sigma-70 family)